MKVKVRCSLGEKLKSEGRTQTWLAEQIGTHSPMVNDWVKGKSTPSHGYTLRILKVTGWKYEELFEEE